MQDAAAGRAVQCPKALMDDSTQPDVTRLLRRWNAGERNALDSLIEIVYPELRRIARRYLGKQVPGQTLQSTTIVHEAYLRLAGKQDLHDADRAHFFVIAARIKR